MYDNSLTSTVVKFWWESISEAQLFRTTVRWFWFLDKYQCFCSSCKKMSQKNFRNPVFYFLTVQLFMRSSRRDCRTHPVLLYLRSWCNKSISLQCYYAHKNTCKIHRGQARFKNYFNETINKDYLWLHWNKF